MPFDDSYLEIRKLADVPVSRVPLPEWVRSAETIHANALAALDDARARAATVRDDEDLSDAGKSRRLAALAEDVRRRLKAEADRIAAMRTAGEQVAVSIEARMAPAEPADRVEAAEIRSVMRALPAERRNAAIEQAIAKGDRRTLAAVLDAPAWDETLTLNIAADHGLRSRAKRALASLVASDDLRGLQAGSDALDEAARRLRLVEMRLVEEKLI